ncbi:MAG: PaaI family thioesterase [Chloroflexota bacterium]
MSDRAFQDVIPGNQCWGCGPHNKHGLHVKSYWQGQESVCRWEPASYFMAGPPHILNGGIIATIIDCHCVCTAIAAAYRSEDRCMESLPPIWYATGSLKVTYLRPTPISGAAELRARIESASARKTVLSCTLLAAGEERVQAEVVAIRVPEGWRDPD